MSNSKSLETRRLHLLLIAWLSGSWSLYYISVSGPCLWFYRIDVIYNRSTLTTIWLFIFFSILVSLFQRCFCRHIRGTLGLPLVCAWFSIILALSQFYAMLPLLLADGLVLQFLFPFPCSYGSQFVFSLLKFVLYYLATFSPLPITLRVFSSSLVNCTQCSSILAFLYLHIDITKPDYRLDRPKLSFQRWMSFKFAVNFNIFCILI